MNMKNLLRGIGSVLNIWPAHRHERLYQRVRFHKIARLGKARHGTAWHGLAWPGLAWLGWARFLITLII